MDLTDIRFGTSGALGLEAAMNDEVCYAYVATFLASPWSMSGSLPLGDDLRPSSPRMLDRLLVKPAAASKWLVPQSGELVITDTTDGLYITFANDNIVYLRPSGNAPEFHCCAESESVELAIDLCCSCMTHFGSVPNYPSWSSARFFPLK